MATPEQLHLEQLLATAAREPHHAPAFLQLLLDSMVLVPGVPNPNDPSGRSINLNELTDSSGRKALPFYTSGERLNETIAAVPGFQPGYFALRTRDLLAMTRGATLVLNPHSAWGKEFLPAEIAQLLDGMTLDKRELPVNTQVFVGAPAQVPDGMTDALSRVFEQHPDVERGYLGWKVTPGDDGSASDSAYLVVIVGPADLPATIGADLGKALVFFGGQHPIDVIFALPGEQHLLHNLEPFYERH